MKKVFISVALAAALAFGASAQSIPGWYSYQGVSDVKSQEISVILYLTDANRSECYYVEEHTVTTNAAGAFSCQLGLGTPDPKNFHGVYGHIEEIDWAAGPYMVVTYINGAVAGEAQLGAVPYATIAGKALGVAGVENVAEELEALWQKNEDQDIFTTQLVNRVEANTEAIEMYAEGFDEQLTNVATLATGATNIAMANEEAIAELQEQATYAVEQADNALLLGTQLSNGVLALEEQVTKNEEDIANISSELPELTEQVHSNKVGLSLLEAKVDALSGGADVDLSGVNEAIEDLQQRMENQELGFTQLNNVVTDLGSEVQTNIDAINDLEGWKVEAQPMLQGMNGAIAKLQEDVDINIEAIANLEQAMTEISPAVAGMNGAIAKLQEDVDINIEAIANLEQAMTEISPAVAGMNGAIAALQADNDINKEAIDNLEQAISELSPAVKGNTGAIAALQADNDINKEAIANAEQTLIDLTETVKGNSAAISILEEKSGDVWAEIARIKDLLTTQGMAIADLQDLITNIVK